MYHVNLEGKVAVCNAKVSDCPFGVNRHFATSEEASTFSQSELVENFGLIAQESEALALSHQEFQSRVMLEPTDTLNQWEQDITDALVDLKSLKMLTAKSRLRIIADARKGINKTEVDLTERENRERKITEERNRLENLSLKLSQQEIIEIPKSCERYMSNHKWSRVNTKAYRGESREPQAKNGGLAIYGQGIYSSTKTAYAKKFGTVREVSHEELPANPIKFENALDFSQFEYELAEANGFGTDKSTMLSHINIDEVIWKMGYDGVVVNRGEIIVNFDTLENRKRYAK